MYYCMTAVFFCTGVSSLNVVFKIEQLNSLSISTVAVSSVKIGKKHIYLAESHLCVLLSTYLVPVVL